MMAMGGGLVLAYRLYSQSRPSPVWVPLRINPDVSDKQRDESVRQLKDKLSESARLAAICKDLGLASKWHLGSDEAAARELGQRLFVKVGEMDGPIGKVPSINIGVHGKRKEKQLSEAIVMRMMDDVGNILGIKPPPKKN